MMRVKTTMRMSKKILKVIIQKHAKTYIQMKKNASLKMRIV